MTEFEDILSTIAPELKELNERMRSALYTSNSMMNEIVSNYLTTKGKQIRPVMVLLSAKLFGGINSAALHGAAAIEILHNASLIHDDVVDETKMRRGQPTINAVWNNHIAVLVGDFFVSVALHEALLGGNKDMVDTIGSLGRQLSLGEIDQINKARHHYFDEDAYMEIIGNKTASLFVACIRMGALATNASAADRECMERFGKLIGLAFQIRDDIFDYFPDSKNIGKPTGNDLREGKVTLPLLYALRRTDMEECAAMNELVRHDELNADEINRLIEYAKKAGGIDYAYKCMEQQRNEAAELLNHFPESPTRAAFLSIFDYIIHRTY
jgi:octaprenyl-diphosphate synthase